MRKLIILSLIFFVTKFHGQQKLKSADKLFDEMAYVDAVKLYEEYAQSNSDLSIETIMNIADSYYFINDTRNALTWYQKLYDLQGQGLTDLYVLRYTQSLRGVRDYDKANTISKEFLRKKNDNTEAKRFMHHQKILDSLATKESAYQVTNLDINTSNSDFGAAFYGNKLVYSSTKSVGDINKKIYSWNQQPFLSMFVADRNLTNGSLINEQPFLNELASKYHDATITFSNDLKTFYYTTNTLKRNKLKNDRKGNNNFQIIKASLNDDVISKSEGVFFNSVDYSVGHPSLSPDGKLFFFVSDMPGGYGETDIYMAEVFPDGSMNSPINLGPKINTIGREMFPFYSNGVLYFSSEGHYGYGGLDVFESKYIGKKFSDPKNLGEPINSNKDDFSFIIDLESKYGYLSSNRGGGKGDDDIYFFRKKDPECFQTVMGKVLNSKNKNAIEGASIKFYDSFNDLKFETITNAMGQFEMKVPCKGFYKVIASKSNHTSQEKEITLGDKNGEIVNLDFDLANLEDFVVKDNGNEKIDINPIFFNYDKWDITPQAAVELDKVVYVMMTFPKVKIRIESHTDSRGKDLYNLKLSDNRAKSTQTYILSKGISSDRIESAVGFGETRLRNKCKNGVKCSEDEHFVNRRSDFIIVEK
ncbi:OmpA family protein [Flavobacterium terrae]|uniref:WD40-like Beta Propeller Repeat n=1 Tax=Flavobacterium terrae TaxID=415425 RepID=A0A1M6CSJ3_9FLAO|nr:OmpA family protein [Flavobacterium terrae]SHI63956.1 WD40-like Beta Propeller Repeat [Flavobacterium terrae]